MLSLAEIESAPERIAELTPDEALQMAQRLAALQFGLVVRAHTKTPDASAVRLLGLEETARRMDVLPSWLQRHARGLPFATKIGKEWRFSETGLAKYLEKRAA